MTVKDMMAEFKRDVASVINRHGIDNLCNTPDYILASHLSDELLSLGRAINTRDSWFGFKPFDVESNINAGKDIR